MGDHGRGPSAGAILVGIFLTLFGLCLLLTGGACTIIWLGSIPALITYGVQKSQFVLFAISVGTLLLGLLCTVKGVGMARGKYRRKPADAGGGASDG